MPMTDYYPNYYAKYGQNNSSFLDVQSARHQQTLTNLRNLARSI